MLENLNKKQKIIIFALAGIVIIGMLYFIYSKNQINEDINLENDILISNTAITEKTESTEDIVIIHITGSVKNPGIVKLREGSRVEDAIEAAGGLTENADITKVNLAYILEDGIKIRIPSASDEEIGDGEILEDGIGENIIVEENKTSDTKNAQNVNINKAGKEELQTLPGIGASLAERIVEYRNQNGKFASKEDIKNVNGIGESKFENIKEFITVK